MRSSNIACSFGSSSLGGEGRGAKGSSLERERDWKVEKVRRGVRVNERLERERRGRERDIA